MLDLRDSERTSSTESRRDCADFCISRGWVNCEYMVGVAGCVGVATSVAG